MPNARGEITARDRSDMLALRSKQLYFKDIAEIIGVPISRVGYHLRGVPRHPDGRYRMRLARAAMEARALRYTAFVERAAPYVPLLVPPSPF